MDRPYFEVDDLVRRNAMISRILLAFGLSLATCSQLPATDLTKIPRQIGKEPACVGEKHWYCLLVFGPKAETRVWLIHDPGKDWFDPKDDVLYVDRNGNGDLTEAGEKVFAKEYTTQVFLSFAKELETLHLPDFYAGEIMELSGKVRHTNLHIRSHGFSGGQQNYTVSVSLHGKHLQTTSSSLLRFGKTKEDAPIIHFNGPLSLQLVTGTGVTFVPNDGSPPTEEQVMLVPGKPQRIYACVGGEGVGPGTFAAMQADFVPGDVRPVAEFEFTHIDPKKPPIKVKCKLALACCTCKFSEMLDVPKEAAAGKAKVTLSMPSFGGHVFAPKNYTITVGAPLAQQDLGKQP
jgi:hypothetical protein